MEPKMKAFGMQSGSKKTITSKIASFTPEPKQLKSLKNSNKNPNTKSLPKFKK
jgi:hypothetical protein